MTPPTHISGRGFAKALVVVVLVGWHLGATVWGPSEVVTSTARNASERVPDEPFGRTKNDNNNNNNNNPIHDNHNNQNNNDNQKHDQRNNNKCCFSSEGIDLLGQFRAEFEAEEEKAAAEKGGAAAEVDPNDRMAARKWPPERYAEWIKFATNTTAGAELLGGHDCMRKWSTLVLHDVPHYELGDALTNIMAYGETGRFKYFEEPAAPGAPRLLMLGDSVSVGAWLAVQDTYGVTHHDGKASFWSAPTNCLGLPKWESSLNLWLGDCPWDLIHFNIGHHYRPEKHATPEDPRGIAPYEAALTKALETMAAHSPGATLVVALTTPSPFDDPSLAESLTPDNCPHYHKLFVAGVAGHLNDAAKRAAEAFAASHPNQPIKINDRYNAVLPSLAELQKPCDIHFRPEGYGFLARHDYETVFRPVLGLDPPPPTEPPTP